MAEDRSCEETGYGTRISQLAEQTPDRVALILDEDTVTTSVTVSELDRYANALAREYSCRGVQWGDLVTIPLPNDLPALVAILAAWKIGAVPNPVSSHLPKDELHGIVACADSALLVGVDPTAFPSRRVLPLEKILDAGQDYSPLPALERHSGERALASGGSTGKPKLIMPRERAIHNPQLVSGLFRPQRTILVPGPIYHAVPFSSVWQSLFNGCTAVVMKRFDAERCLQLIEGFKIDRVWFVPTMMLRIWKLGDAVRQRYDVSSLTHVFSGGAPMPSWLMRCWIDWLGAEKLYDVFGPSERIGGTMINGVEWLAHPGSVGKPLPYARLKIFDEHGQECPPGVMGEIFTLPQSGQGSTYEYRSVAGVPVPRNRVLDGWESVGDMGYLDEHGYLYLGDRKSDMILSRGRNIYPAEIEAAIQEFAGVRSCAVIGLPDEDGSNRIHAIVDGAGSDVVIDQLRDFLKGKIAPYKMPASFEVVDTLLRNDAGKVRRSALRAERLVQD